MVGSYFIPRSICSWIPKPKFPEADQRQKDFVNDIWNKSYMNCGNEMKITKWSSQWTQFMQLCKEAWKKFWTSTGFDFVTSRLLVQCSANWAMKPLTLEAGQLWVYMFPWKKWVLMIYEINRIWTAEMKWKWRNDHRSELNFMQLRKEAWKKFRISRESIAPVIVSSRV